MSRLDATAVAACYRYLQAVAAWGWFDHRLNDLAQRAYDAAGYNQHTGAGAEQWIAVYHAARRLQGKGAFCLESNKPDPCIGCTESLD